MLALAIGMEGHAARPVPAEGPTKPSRFQATGSRAVKILHGDTGNDFGAAKITGKIRLQIPSRSSQQVAEKAEEALG